MYKQVATVEELTKALGSLVGRSDVNIFMIPEGGFDCPISKALIEALGVKEFPEDLRAQTLMTHHNKAGEWCERKPTAEESILSSPERTVKVSQVMLVLARLVFDRYRALGKMFTSSSGLINKLRDMCTCPECGQVLLETSMNKVPLTGKGSVDSSLELFVANLALEKVKTAFKDAQEKETLSQEMYQEWIKLLDVILEFNPKCEEAILLKGDIIECMGKGSSVELQLYRNYLKSSETVSDFDVLRRVVYMELSSIFRSFARKVSGTLASKVDAIMLLIPQEAPEDLLLVKSFLSCLGEFVKKPTAEVFKGAYSKFVSDAQENGGAFASTLLTMVEQALAVVDDPGHSLDFSKLGLSNEDPNFELHIKGCVGTILVHNLKLICPAKSALSYSDAFQNVLADVSNLSKLRVFLITDEDFIALSGFMTDIKSHEKDIRAMVERLSKSLKSDSSVGKRLVYLVALIVQKFLVGGKGSGKLTALIKEQLSHFPYSGHEASNLWTTIYDLVSPYLPVDRLHDFVQVVLPEDADSVLKVSVITDFACKACDRGDFQQARSVLSKFPEVAEDPQVLLILLRVHMGLNELTCFKGIQPPKEVSSPEEAQQLLFDYVDWMTSRLSERFFHSSQALIVDTLMKEAVLLWQYVDVLTCAPVKTAPLVNRAPALSFQGLASELGIIDSEEEKAKFYRMAWFIGLVALASSKENQGAQWLFISATFGSFLAQQKEFPYVEPARQLVQRSLALCTELSRVPVLFFGVSDTSSEAMRQRKQAEYQPVYFMCFRLMELLRFTQPWAPLYPYMGGIDLSGAGLVCAPVQDQLAADIEAVPEDSCAKPLANILRLNLHTFDLELKITKLKANYLSGDRSCDVSDIKKQFEAAFLLLKQLDSVQFDSYEQGLFEFCSFKLAQLYLNFLKMTCEQGASSFQPKAFFNCLLNMRVLVSMFPITELPTLYEELYVYLDFARSKCSPKEFRRFVGGTLLETLAYCAGTKLLTGVEVPVDSPMLHVDCGGIVDQAYFTRGRQLAFLRNQLEDDVPFLVDGELPCPCCRGPVGDSTIMMPVVKCGETAYKPGKKADEVLSKELVVCVSPFASRVNEASLRLLVGSFDLAVQSSDLRPSLLKAASPVILAHRMFPVRSHLVDHDVKSNLPLLEQEMGLALESEDPDLARAYWQAIVDQVAYIKSQSSYHGDKEDVLDAYTALACMMMGQAVDIDRVDSHCSVGAFVHILTCVRDTCSKLDVGSTLDSVFARKLDHPSKDKFDYSGLCQIMEIYYSSLVKQKCLFGSEDRKCHKRFMKLYQGVLDYFLTRVKITEAEAIQKAILSYIAISVKLLEFRLFRLKAESVDKVKGLRALFSTVLSAAFNHFSELSKMRRNGFSMEFLSSVVMSPVFQNALQAGDAALASLESEESFVALWEGRDKGLLPQVETPSSFAALKIQWVKSVINSMTLYELNDQVPGVVAAVKPKVSGYAYGALRVLELRHLVWSRGLDDPETIAHLNACVAVREHQFLPTDLSIVKYYQFLVGLSQCRPVKELEPLLKDFDDKGLHSMDSKLFGEVSIGVMDWYYMAYPQDFESFLTLLSRLTDLHHLSHMLLDVRAHPTQENITWLVSAFPNLVCVQTLGLVFLERSDVEEDLSLFQSIQNLIMCQLERYFVSLAKYRSCVDDDGLPFGETSEDGKRQAMAAIVTDMSKGGRVLPTPDHSVNRLMRTIVERETYPDSQLQFKVCLIYDMLQREQWDELVGLIEQYGLHEMAIDDSSLGNDLAYVQLIHKCLKGYFDLLAHKEDLQLEFLALSKAQMTQPFILVQLSRLFEHKIQTEGELSDHLNWISAFEWALTEYPGAKDDESVLESHVRIGHYAIRAFDAAQSNGDGSFAKTHYELAVRLLNTDPMNDRNRFIAGTAAYYAGEKSMASVYFMATSRCEDETLSRDSFLWAERCLDREDYETCRSFYLDWAKRWPGTEQAWKGYVAFHPDIRFASFMMGQISGAESLDFSKLEAVDFYPQSRAFMADVEARLRPLLDSSIPQLAAQAALLLANISYCRLMDQFSAMAAYLELHRSLDGYQGVALDGVEVFYLDDGDRDGRLCLKFTPGSFLETAVTFILDAVSTHRVAYNASESDSLLEPFASIAHWCKALKTHVLDGDNVIQLAEAKVEEDSLTS